MTTSITFTLIHVNFILNPSILECIFSLNRPGIHSYLGQTHNLHVQHDMTITVFHCMTTFFGHACTVALKKSLCSVLVVHNAPYTDGNIGTVLVRN